MRYQPYQTTHIGPGQAPDANTAALDRYLDQTADNDADNTLVDKELARLVDEAIVDPTNDDTVEALLDSNQVKGLEGAYRDLMSIQDADNVRYMPTGDMLHLATCAMRFKRAMAILMNDRLLPFAQENAKNALEDIPQW